MTIRPQISLGANFCAIIITKDIRIFDLENWLENLLDNDRKSRWYKWSYYVMIQSYEDTARRTSV